MTLTRAVAILNQRRHRGEDRWEIEQQTGDPASVMVTAWNRHEDALSAFEAVAIAEKYEQFPPNLSAAEIEPLFIPLTPEALPLQLGE